MELTVNSFATYVLANPARRKKEIYDAKFPDPEGRARRDYHRDVRRVLIEYQKNGHHPQWLVQEAESVAIALDGDISESMRIRIRTNVDLIHAYHRYFSSRKIELIRRMPSNLYTHSGVDVKVTPDFFGKEGRWYRLIKFQFSQLEVDPEDHAKIVGQLMLETDTENLRSSAMQVLNCRTGDCYKSARVRSRTTTHIEHACSEIAAIWPTIKRR